MRATHGHLHDAEAVVTAAGGRIGRELSIIDGFAAVVPADALATIGDSAVVLSVSDDAPLTPMSVDSPDSTRTRRASAGQQRPRQRDRRVQLVGATQRRVHRDEHARLAVERHAPHRCAGAVGAGYTGKGVDVALIDTGVAPVAGTRSTTSSTVPTSRSTTSRARRPVSTPTGTARTWRASSRATTRDATDAASDYSDTTKFVGVAPDARIVNVKVGAFNGATDVSQVIAGIDWVVQHRNDNGMNIRVLNLSFGTDSQQSWTDRPAGVRGRGRVAPRHRGGRRRRQRRHRGDVAQRPGLRPADPRGRRVRLRRSLKPGDSVVAAVHERRQRQPRRRRRGTGHAHPQPARPGLVRRPELPRQPGRHALHARLGHVAGRGRHVRLRRRPRAALPERDARPAEGADPRHGDRHPRTRTGPTTARASSTAARR